MESACAAVSHCIKKQNVLSLAIKATEENLNADPM